MNGARAAAAAGYSKTRAKATANNLIHSPVVREALQKKMDERSNRTQIKADRILEELSFIAFSDIGNLFTESNTLKNLDAIDEKHRKTVSSVEVYDEFEFAHGNKSKIGETKKIKMWDKLRALELLGKHLRLFADKIEIDDKSGLAEKLAKAKARLSENE